MRIVILGCGFIGSVHADAIRTAGYELVGVVDADPAIAQRLAVAHGVPWATAPADILRAVGPADAVVIATPPAHHAAGIRWAVANNLAILCEKPLARTAAEARDINERCVSAGLALAVGFKMRFEPLYVKVHQLLRDGVIGTPRSLTATHHQRHPQKIWSDEVGVASELLVHTIDLTRWLLDSEPSAVEGHQSPTDAHVMLTFAGGTTADLSSRWLPEFSDVAGRADHLLQVVGSAGHLVAIRPNLIRVSTDGGTRDHIIAPSDYTRPFVDQWRAFANYIANHREPDAQPSVATGLDGIATLQVIDALSRRV